MKANRSARARIDDEAGAEVVGALILFGIFVTVIAILNVTSVPNAGLASEEEHYETVLSALNGLQADAESAALEGNEGATVAASLALAPHRTIGQDFFSFFMATPARASGELTFEPGYGDVKLFHYKNGAPNAFYDIGNPAATFALGRLTFDPHPVFRGAGVIDVENGAILATGGSTSTVRYEPPVSVEIAGSTTKINVQPRILNGTEFNVGGTAPVRLLVTTESATLVSPPANNAQNVTLVLATDHPAAWQSYLAGISDDAGLVNGTQYYVGANATAVTWIVNGTSNGNDIRLTSGVAVYGVRLS
ncbi:MAG TPA: hypothetical protein VM370_00865 [Candidatus Thermoplasmatota archaeon]|nr:hypothetical protein [Candidatus Thermoplasmatota archaeon]